MSIERGGIPTGAAAITPHDTNENRFAGIYVGTTGNVKVTTIDGDAVTFSSVPAGKDLAVRVKLVWSTGTTASNLVGYR
jgi:hypothetical protein